MSYTPRGYPPLLRHWLRPETQLSSHAFGTSEYNEKRSLATTPITPDRYTWSPPEASIPTPNHQRSTHHGHPLTQSTYPPPASNRCPNQKFSKHFAHYLLTFRPRWARRKQYSLITTSSRIKKIWYVTLCEVITVWFQIRLITIPLCDSNWFFISIASIKYIAIFMIWYSF